jgi:uncharacterized membrane protein YhaH (DUF805 family)
MIDLLPYEYTIHTISDMMLLFGVATLITIVLMQRQISFQRRRAGDPGWENWIRFAPLVYVKHRAMFPASRMRMVSAGFILMIVAGMVTTQQLNNRQQRGLAVFEGLVKARQYDAAAQYAKTLR